MEGGDRSVPNPKTVFTGNINHLVQLRNAYSFHGTVTEIDRHNVIRFHCLDVSLQANKISDFWFVFISQSLGNVSNYVTLLTTIWRNFALWILPTKVTICTSGDCLSFHFLASRLGIGGKYSRLFLSGFDLVGANCCSLEQYVVV